MASGTQPRRAARRATFFCLPRTLNRGGSEAASSMNSWSSSGERASSECAIVAMSIFASRSPGGRSARRPRASGRVVAADAAAPAARDELGVASAPPRPRAKLGRVEAVALARPKMRDVARRSARRVEGQRGRAEAAEAVARPDSIAVARRDPRRRACRARRSGAGRRSGRPAASAVGRVAPVAGEALVAAVAVERDGDVAAGQLGQVEARDRRGVGERLAVVAHEPRQDLDRVAARTTSSWWSVPNRSATWRACGELVEALVRRSRSRRSSPARPTACAIAATTAEESIPPERKAPSGTSATSRRRTRAPSRRSRIARRARSDRRPSRLRA